MFTVSAALGFRKRRARLNLFVAWLCFLLPLLHAVHQLLQLLQLVSRPCLFCLPLFALFASPVSITFLFFLFFLYTSLLSTSPASPLHRLPASGFLSWACCRRLVCLRIGRIAVHPTLNLYLSVCHARRLYHRTVQYLSILITLCTCQ